MSDDRDLARLSAWFDGESGEVESEEVRARLLADPALRARLQDWRALRAGLQALQPEPLDAERMERLRARVSAAALREAGQLDRALRGWMAAAALLVIAAGAWLGIQQRGGFGAAEPAYAREPREIEKAIEDLLAPMPGTPAQSPASGGSLRNRLRAAPAGARAPAEGTGR